MSKNINGQIYQEMEEFGSLGWTVVDGLVLPKMFDEVDVACRRTKARVRAGEIDVYTHWAGDGPADTGRAGAPALY